MDFLRLDGNEKNVKCVSCGAFVFIDVSSFRAKSWGATIYGGLVARIPA
jgi:hypothetical protein